MNLFINPYENEVRDKEYKECLERNCDNPYIDNIIFVRENDRATFQDFFTAIRDYPNDINIISNLDIYFDESLGYANNIKHNECYALTRWERLNGRIVPFRERHPGVPPAWSQDVWIFKGAVNLNGFDVVTANHKSSRTATKIRFTLGIPGADNKFAAMLKASNYKVTNPTSKIKSIHMHTNESRNYGEYQILSGIKPWGMVEPT